MIKFLKELGKWASFTYFLRFAWMLWLFAPAICLLNIQSKTLTSGILVSEKWEQYLCVAFFLISAGSAALVLARIAIINGPERWALLTGEPDDCRPALLKNCFLNDEGKYEFVAVGIAQAPTLLVFAYLLYFGACQGVDLKTILFGLAAGTLLAGIFWWNANAWYYLTFKAPKLDNAPKNFTLGQNAARTILFPRAMFRLNAVNSPCPGKPTIEQADTLFCSTGFERFDQMSGLAALRRFLIARSGYGDEAGNSFYEAHNFASISLVMFLGLYLLIWPLTAPVAAPVASTVALAAMTLFIAFVLMVFWKARPGSVSGKVASLTGIRIWITASIGVFWIAVVALYLLVQIERFPIFATVLILVIAVSWMLGAVAFFFDRYRVPVLTLLLIVLIVPRMFHLDRTVWFDHSGMHRGNGQEEHYVSTSTAKQAAVELPDPYTILAARRQAISDGGPLIIVTATGGGLHASAWTAAVLAHLEQTFGPDFHKHLLLASTVSGGSVGLMPYLRELHDGNLDSGKLVAATERMQSAAQCSSLEGVGWGLVYYDLPKAFVPALPYLVPPSSGDGDLDTNGSDRSPLGKDRTWALRKSFLRNLDDLYCKQVWEDDTHSHARWHSHQEGENGSRLRAGFQTKLKDQTGSGLTVRDFSAGSDPAFTMNTTVVESGERFLSANYRIPDCLMEDKSRPDYRARSFLETFKTRTDGVASDLPLASAAQLSATFPFVSSSARAPMVLDNAVNSVHFADGGYYDNDGTASALEFLRYALGPPATPNFQNPCPVAEVSKDSPLRILLIEIRNSNDIAGSGSESSPDRIAGASPWNLFSQVGAPLLGFWQAGHESITPRDQSSLELLEHAYAGKLIMRSVVFADECSTTTVGTDPLNWSLTPLQRKEVLRSAGLSKLTKLYEKAHKWFIADASEWSKNPTEDSGPDYPNQCSAK